MKILKNVLVIFLLFSISSILLAIDNVFERYPQYNIIGEYKMTGFLRFGIQNQFFSETNKGTSLIQKTGLFASDFYQLGYISTKNENFNKIIIGDWIKTEFTPLTFNKTFGGVQWDGKVGYYKWNILYSRISDPGKGSPPGSGIFSQASLWKEILGTRIERETKKYKVGLNFLNSHWADGKISSDLLKGAYISPKLYIRLGDSRPTDGYGGQILGIDVDIEPGTLYDVSFNVGDPQELTYFQGGGKLAGSYRFADGEDIINYAIPVPDNMTSIKIRLKLGGQDRLVLISPDGFQNKIVQLPDSIVSKNDTGMIDVISELGISISDFNLGYVNTGQTTWGVDLSGNLFRFKYEIDYIYSTKFNKNREGEQNDLSSTSYRIALKRSFAGLSFFDVYTIKNLEFGFIYFDINKDYNASEFIDDNDDNDIYPDSDSKEDYIIPGNDRNVNGIPDYIDGYFTSIYNSPFYFDREDFNCNGIPDEVENDRMPDYPRPFLPGQKGILFDIKFLPVQNISLIYSYLSYRNQNKFKTKRDSIRIIYNNIFDRTVKMTIFNEFNFVKDNIPDNIIGELNGIDDDGDGIIDESDERNIEIADSLNFKDSFYNIFSSFIEYIKIKNFNAGINTVIKLNKQYINNNTQIDARNLLSLTYKLSITPAISFIPSLKYEILNYYSANYFYKNKYSGSSVIFYGFPVKFKITDEVDLIGLFSGIDSKWRFGNSSRIYTSGFELNSLTGNTFIKIGATITKRVNDFDPSVPPKEYIFYVRMYIN